MNNGIRFFHGLLFGLFLSAIIWIVIALLVFG